MNTHIVSDTFTRPADTTAYASGDLVSSTVDDSTATYLTFTRCARGPGHGFIVRRARLHKSDGTDVANAAFRLHLFSAAPTFTSAGDNGAIASVLQGSANWIGSLDITAMFGLQSGAIGEGKALAGDYILHKAGADLNLYGALEARGAYTPASAEVFIVSLEIEWLD
jgi:hypothetical protein